MKVLYPKQSEAHDFFVGCLGSGKNTLDSSHMGTGKTVVGSQVARTMISQSVSLDSPVRTRSYSKVAVICPKAVFPAWKSELAECGIDPLFILNVEKLRTGKSGWVKKIGKKNYKWQMPTDTLILVDEIHKLKGPWTQNAGLLIGLVKQGFRIHGMSGTPCETPMEMRPLGYMLRLHSNEASRNGLNSYFQWMRLLRCKKGQWGGYEMTDSAYALNNIRRNMYGVNTQGLTVKDFPESFRGNRVLVDPIEFTNNDKIIKSYEGLNMSAADVSNYIEKGETPEHLLYDEDEEIILVKILRARMECELYKVADIAEMAQDAIGEGYNVAIFLNFIRSMAALADVLGCGLVDGSTPEEERVKHIDAFQRDETNCLILNAATGGTGISLHDTIGNRPRLALISPSFNSKEFAQVIGRIHRNGAKSDALQKVLLSNGSIEEYVMSAINKKLGHMKTLHHSSPCEFETSHYK